MKAVVIVFVLVLLSCTITTIAAWAHRAPTNTEGCHVDPDTGHYHCHP